MADWMNGFQNDTPHAEATVNTPMNCIAAKVKANMCLDWIMVFSQYADDLRPRAECDNFRLATIRPEPAP